MRDWQRRKIPFKIVWSYFEGSNFFGCLYFVESIRREEDVTAEKVGLDFSESS